MTTANSNFRRVDGRAVDETRKVTITRGFTDNLTSSVLVTFGDTRVMCTAFVEQSMSRSKRDSGEGQLTAECSILPTSTHERMPHESMHDEVRGRTHGISRLIDRSLRAAIDLREFGEDTISIDCDVLQVDDGTCITSITGAYTALADTLTYLHAVGTTPGTPLKAPTAAVSAGIVNGRACLDLPYEEDSHAEVDLDVMMIAEGKFVEIQGAGEEGTLGRDQLNDMFDSAEKDLCKLTAL